MPTNVDYHEHDGTYAHYEHDHAGDYAPHHHDHDEYVEHHECDKFAKKCDVSKKGVAEAGLGLGIAGTVLGGAALLRNGGLFGGRGRRGCDGGYEDGGYEGGYHIRREERHERHYEIRQAERISLLEAQLAQQGAERYAAEGDCRTYKELRCVIEKETDENERRINKLFDKVCSNDKELAVMQARTEAKLECLNDKIFTVGKTLQHEIDSKVALEAERRECCCKEADLKLRLEAERRECGDKNLFDYMNCHFVRNKKVVPADEICPSVMPRFNAFDFDRVDDCGCRERRGERKEHGKPNKD